MPASLKLTVERADGTSDTFPVLPITHVAYERHYSTSITKIESAPAEHLYWLAWDAEHRAGRVVKPFDEWLANIVSVTPEQEAAPLGTPSPVASPASPPSPE